MNLQQNNDKINECQYLVKHNMIVLDCSEPR